METLKQSPALLCTSGSNAERIEQKAKIWNWYGFIGNQWVMEIYKTIGQWVLEVSRILKLYCSSKWLPEKWIEILSNYVIR